MKQNRFFLSSLFIFFVLCQSLFASSVTLGYGKLKFDYNEYDSQGQWLDSEISQDDGLDGFSIQYAKTFGKLFNYSQKVEFQYSYFKGETLYDGHLQNLNTFALTPYKTTTNNKLQQTHIRYYLFSQNQKNEVGLFTGLGYRLWERDIQGPYGLFEEYKWLYGEIGLNGLWYDGNFFTGFEISYQQAYKPKMEASINSGLEFDLGKTKGYKIKVPFGYEVNKNYKLAVNYIYDRWEIEQSNVVSGFVEPSSWTKNSYWLLSLQYNF